MTDQAGKAIIIHTSGLRYQTSVPVAGIGPAPAPAGDRGSAPTRHEISRIVGGDQLELDLVRVLVQVVSGDSQAHRHIPDLSGSDVEIAGLVVDRDARQARGAQQVGARLLLHVEHLEAIDVLDPAVARFAIGSVAVAQHVEGDRHALRQRDRDGRDDSDHQYRIDNDPRTQDPGLQVLHGVESGVAHQAARRADLVHDLVAGIDAGGAGDALVLQAVADVDAGRTGLDAEGAVDAVAERFLRLGLPARARAARLAAYRVVGDDQRVAVEHGALEARIRAHVDADLLAHLAGEEQDRDHDEGEEKGLPRPQRSGEDLPAELADRGERAESRERRPDGEGGEERPLDGELAGARQRETVLAQANLARAVALDPAFDPDQHLGEDGLRTGVAAPDPPGECREEEERQRRHHQQGGEVDQVLRPEHQAEEVELARRQVEQKGLPVFPAQPGQTVENPQGEKERRVAQPREAAVHDARMDLLVNREVGVARFTARGHDPFERP